MRTTMSATAGSIGAAPRSIYARSRLFRWGSWLLLLSAVLFVWSGVKQASVAQRGELQTVAGTVVDYKSQRTTQRYMGGGSGRRFRGDTGSINILRLRKPDGTITEFSSRTWIRPPRRGWIAGQPIRVQHDQLRDLYEVIVAGETLQDLAATQLLRRKESKGPQPFAVLFLVLGLPMVALGFVLTRIGSAPSATFHPIPPPPLPKT